MEIKAGSLNTEFSTKEVSSAITTQNDDISIFLSNCLNTIIIDVVNSAFAEPPFTKEEAEIYVQGEKELAGIIAEEKSKQSFLKQMFGFDDIETNCRKQYAQKHEEYAAVMKRGMTIQKQHDEALSKVKEDWLKSNPEPEHLFQEGGILGIERTEEYKNWENNLKELIETFEYEYMKTDTNYRKLYEAKNNDKSLGEKLTEEILYSMFEEII